MRTGRTVLCGDLAGHEIHRVIQRAWDIGLAIFGVRLLGLGAPLVRALSFGRVMVALVVIAGVGYIMAFGRLLVADYGLTLSMLTFVGEALLIVWLFRLAIRGPSRRG